MFQTAQSLSERAKNAEKNVIKKRKMLEIYAVL